MPVSEWSAIVGESRPTTDSKPSASSIYRAAASKDEFPKLDVETLYELFTNSVSKYAKSECLGHRPKGENGKAGPFVFQTYEEVGKNVSDLASGMHALGVKPTDRVGILGPNCPEWMKAMQACNRMSYCCVPLYDSLGENAIEFIINHSEATLAFVSTTKFPAMIKSLPMTKDALKTVVYWGETDAASIETFQSFGYKLFSIDEVIKMGQDKPAEPVPPKADAMATIMYTSGTTGDPKGVMLSHTSILTGVANSHFFGVRSGLKFLPGDRFLSYLPLAHIFDRVQEEWFLYFGGTIGYFQGNVLTLMDDIQALKPAYFVGVPRVYDRIYSKVMGGLKSAGFVKRLLFNWGYNRKLQSIKRGVPQHKAAPFFDKIVFSKVAKALGGNVKVVVSGGAPLAPHVEDFLRATMCCPVVQGYGLTETAASSFCAAPDVIGHNSTVGPPAPATELRFESVPEMGYDALDEQPKGEILIRGGANFMGYYKDEKKTEEEVEADGWFHTGDIGMLNQHGSLKIIDRKKNIFKLSQGEYVAVEKLESTYKKNLITENVWVYGDSLKSTLVAVVVPSEALLTWAKGEGIEGDMAALCQDERAKEHVVAELTATGKADKLKGYEMIKKVHMVPEPFSVDDGLITPTFKFKRPQLQKKFQSEIDAMYKLLE